MHEANPILVTGGAGYIGATLTHQLLQKGYSVVVIDNLTFGGEALLGVWGHPRFAFHKVDITDAAALRAVFDRYRFRGIAHLAAIVGDPACARQPQRARAVNWDASLHLLELARQHRVERFVFASTCSNYGKMPDPNGYVDETAPLRPVSLYAELKVAFERVLLEELPKEDGFVPVSLRFATAYGAAPRPRFDLTVNEFTRELTLGRRLEVYGEQFWRPYTHVYDLARAVILALEAPAAQVAYDVFNVGDTRENYQKKTLVELIRQVVPDRGEVVFVHKDEDPRDYRVSFEKIRRVLGYRITRRVPDGIREIHDLIRSGFISNPDDPRYRNVP